MRLVIALMILLVACGGDDPSGPVPSAAPHVAAGWQFVAECPARYTTFTVEAASPDGTALSGTQEDSEASDSPFVLVNSVTVTVSYGARSVTYSEDPELEAEFGVPARTGAMHWDPDVGYTGDGDGFCTEAGEGRIQLRVP